MVEKYINILWNKVNNGNLEIPGLLDSQTCNTITTTFTTSNSRIRQCAAKQACSMVKAATEKRRKQLYKLRELQRENKSTLYLQRKIEKQPLVKPNCENINVELDSRFVHFKEDGKTFDVFLQLSQLGITKKKIRLPIKHTKVSKKWLQEGKLKNSIRINKDYIVLFYEVEKEQYNNKKILGADQGQTTCLSLSDGQTTKVNNHGYDLSKIQDVLSRRKKGSKGFRRSQSHRKNYINWSINQLNFNDVKEVRLEKIYNIRRNKKSRGRKDSHWTYTLIKDKLIRLSEDKGFVVTEQDNKFRSQRCSNCGWTHKSNRKGKTFRCSNANCGFTTDSDLNAASNHEVNLCEINFNNKVWQEHLNRTIGFYWLENEVVFGEEHIVPHVQEI